MFSIVKSAEERLQHSVDDFRKQTWLEWLSLLHSDLAESELGCVQLHTCHFIGRNVAVLYLSQTYNDAKEHKIIILSLSFKNVYQRALPMKNTAMQTASFFLLSWE